MGGSRGRGIKGGEMAALAEIAAGEFGPMENQKKAPLARGFKDCAE
jgi:hypothetical protein